MARTGVRLGRAVAACVAVAGAVTIAGARANGAPSRESRSVPVVRVVHVVGPGETVWGIARSLVGPEGDPRPVVDAMVRVNHLGRDMVQPGQRLVLPAS